MALSFENFATWIISGAVVAIFLWTFYYFFIRFHFEWIPVSFGMLREIIVVNNLTYTIGGSVMILLASAILFIWYRIIIKDAPGIRYLSTIPK
jgi:hypothetical protein